MSRATATERLFVDEVIIHVRGGKGGDGCVSFRREKFVPKGGPDGGDGGHGGAVYLEAQDGLDTLLHLAGRHHWHADNGRPGHGSNCAGKRGRPLVVPVPPGTLVYDTDGERLLKDLMTPGDRVRVARGGRGGRGNAYYVSSTHQAPREFQPGLPGQERTLRLELKLIADAGFVGLPNAGKSTLLSRLTRARPKIAAYPFTTREPHLGIVELSDFRRMVLADLPGLIEGAHRGVGLGHASLRHGEPTRVIVPLPALCPPEGAPAPPEAYRIIRGELEHYSAALAQRPEIVVGNKLDLTGAREALAELRAALGRDVLGISGVSGEGMRELAEEMWRVVSEARQQPEPQRERIDFGPPGDDTDEDDYDDRPPEPPRAGGPEDEPRDEPA